MPRLDAFYLPAELVANSLQTTQMVEADTCDSTDARIHVEFRITEDAEVTTTTDGDMMPGPILINFSTEETLLRFVAERNYIITVLFVFSWRNFNAHQSFTAVTHAPSQLHLSISISTTYTLRLNHLLTERQWQITSKLHVFFLPRTLKKFSSKPSFVHAFKHIVSIHVYIALTIHRINTCLHSINNMRRMS